VVVEALIVVGCYAAFWSNLGGMAEIVRPLIFASLLLAAFWALASSKMQRVLPTPTEFLLYAIGLLSGIVSLVRSEDYCIYYTMYFLAILVFTSVITRTLSLERLMDLGAVVTLLCIGTSLIVDGHSFVTTLRVTIGPNGILRFSPLNNHPLLTGYIFGSGSLLLMRRVYLSRSLLERVIMSAGVLFAWAFTIAASARSSVVGLLMALGFAAVMEFRVFNRLSAKRIALGASILTVTALVYFGFASSYLADILQLNSSYRGFGTGATGRTDLWMKGVQSLVSDPYLIAFGGGLRSSEYSVIGFLTENSYLTMLLDSGIFAGAALVFAIVSCPIRALRLQRSRAPSEPNTLICLASFFIFSIVQCFFIRNFIGIGNPTSLLTLLFLISLSMRTAPDRRASRQPVRNNVETSLARARP
jgi:hypothetical protein